MMQSKVTSVEGLISSKSTSMVSRTALLLSTRETELEVSHFFALLIILVSESAASGALAHLTFLCLMVSILWASVSVRELVLSNQAFNVASAIVLILETSL